MAKFYGICCPFGICNSSSPICSFSGTKIIYASILFFFVYNYYYLIVCYHILRRSINPCLVVKLFLMFYINIIMYLYDLREHHMVVYRQNLANMFHNLMIIQSFLRIRKRKKIKFRGILHISAKL